MDSNKNISEKSAKISRKNKILFHKSLSMKSINKNLKNEIRKINPDINRFNLDSVFIYESIF